jgi:hypothetical protein
MDQKKPYYRSTIVDKPKIQIESIQVKHIPTSNILATHGAPDKSVFWGIMVSPYCLCFW